MFEELSDGVFRRRFESLDLNIGVVMADAGLVVIDTRASHVEADELQEELRTLTPLPVRWVIDTHWHWDHTFGNSRFPDAEIWGHDLCRKNMVERGDSMKDDAAAWLPERKAEFDAVEIVPPSKVVTDTAQIDLGSQLVTMSYHGLGHTDADLVISVGEVSFMGDLLEEGSPPVFDDGYPLSWPRTLRSALGTTTSLLVPGHGNTMDLAAALSQLEEIEAVAALARRCVEEGLPVPDASRLGPYPANVMTSALTRAIAVGL